VNKAYNTIQNKEEELMGDGMEIDEFD